MPLAGPSRRRRRSSTRTTDCSAAHLGGGQRVGQGRGVEQHAHRAPLAGARLEHRCGGSPAKSAGAPASRSSRAMRSTPSARPRRGRRRQLHPLDPGGIDQRGPENADRVQCLASDSSSWSAGSVECLPTFLDSVLASDRRSERKASARSAAVRAATAWLRSSCLARLELRDPDEAPLQFLRCQADQRERQSDSFEQAWPIRQQRAERFHRRGMHSVAGAREAPPRASGWATTHPEVAAAARPPTSLGHDGYNVPLLRGWKGPP